MGGVGIKIKLRFKALFMLFLMISLMFAQFSFVVAVDGSPDVSSLQTESENGAEKSPVEYEGCYEKEYLSNGLSVPGCGPVMCGTSGVIYGQFCQCDSRDGKSMCKMEDTCKDSTKINCGEVRKVNANLDVLIVEKETSLVLFFISDSKDKEQTYMFKISNEEDKPIHDLYFYNILTNKDGSVTFRVYVFGKTVRVHDIDIKSSEDSVKLQFSMPKESSEYQYLPEKYKDYTVEKVLSKDKNNKHKDFFIVNKEDKLSESVNGYLLVLKSASLDVVAPIPETPIPEDVCADSYCQEKVIVGAEFTAEFNVPDQLTFESKSVSDSSDLYNGLFKEQDGTYSEVRISDGYVSEIEEEITEGIIINGKTYDINEKEILMGGSVWDLEYETETPYGNALKTLQTEIYMGVPANKITVDNDANIRLPSYLNIFQLKAWFAESKTDGALDTTAVNFCDVNNFIPGAQIDFISANVYTKNSNDNSVVIQPIPLKSSDDYCNMAVDLSGLDRSDYTSLHEIELHVIYSYQFPEGRKYYHLEASDNFRFWSGSQVPPAEQSNIEFDNPNINGVIVYTAKGTELSEISNSRLFGTNIIIFKEINVSSDICVSKGITCEDACIKEGGKYYLKSIVEDGCVGIGLKKIIKFNSTNSTTSTEHADVAYVCCFDNSEQDKCGGLDQPPCVFGCKSSLSACKSEDGKGVCKDLCDGGFVSQVKIDEDGKIGVDGEGTLVDPNQGVTPGAEGNADVESDYPSIEIKSIVLEDDKSVQTIVVDENTPAEIEKTIKLKVENLDFEDIIIYADLVSIKDSNEPYHRILIATEAYGDDTTPGFGYYDTLAYDADISLTTIPIGDYKLKVKVEQAGAPGRETERFWYGDSENKGVIRIISKDQLAQEEAETKKEGTKFKTDGSSDTNNAIENDKIGIDNTIPSLEDKTFTNEEKLRIEKAMGKFFSEKKKYDTNQQNLDNYFNSIIELFALAFTLSENAEQGINFVDNTKDYNVEQKLQFIEQFNNYLADMMKDYNAKLILDNVGAVISAANIILPDGATSDNGESFWSALKYQVKTIIKSPTKLAYTPWETNANTGLAIDYSIKVALDQISSNVKGPYASLVTRRIAEINTRETRGDAKDKTNDQHYRSELLAKNEKAPSSAQLYLNHLYYTPAVLRDADNYINDMYSNFYCTDRAFIQDWVYYDVCQTLFIQRVNNYKIYDENFYGSSDGLDKFFELEKSFLINDRGELDATASRMHWMSVGDIIITFGVGVATGSIVASAVTKIAQAGKIVYTGLMTVLVAGTVYGIGIESYQHYMCFSKASMEEQAFKSRYYSADSDLEATNTILARCTEDTALTVAFFGGGFLTTGKPMIKEVSKSKVYVSNFKKWFSEKLFEEPRIKEATKGKSEFKGTQNKAYSSKTPTGEAGKASTGTGTKISEPEFKFGVGEAGSTEWQVATNKMNDAFNKMFKIPNNKYLAVYYQDGLGNMYATAKARIKVYVPQIDKMNSKGIVSLSEKLFDAKDVAKLKNKIRSSGLTKEQQAVVLKSLDDEIARIKTDFKNTLNEYIRTKDMSPVNDVESRFSQKQQETGSPNKEKKFNKEKSVPKSNNGIIDPADAYSSEGSLSTVITGKRDIGFSSLTAEQVKSAENAGLKLVNVKQKGVSNNYIYYRSGAESRAARLLEIANKHGGGLKDETIDEAYEIGRLLGYSDESINSYVKNVYDPNGVRLKFRIDVKAGKGKVQEVVMDGHGGVVQDAVFSKISKNGKFTGGVADGVSGAGPNSAKSAKIILEGTGEGGNKVSGLVDKLDELVGKFGYDYAKIYSELDFYARNVLDPAINLDTQGATTTVIVSHITKDYKLITYRIGDTEARVIRKSRLFGGKKMYHIDQLYDASNKKIFNGEILNNEIFRSPITTEIQAVYSNAPNQIGQGGTSPGYMSVHQLKPGDRLILSSDGFTPKKGSLNDNQIFDIVSNANAPEEAEQTLVSEALRRIYQTQGSETRGDDLGNLIIFVPK